MCPFVTSVRVSVCPPTVESIMVSIASQPLAGARISKDPEGPEILVPPKMLNWVCLLGQVGFGMSV